MYHTWGAMIERASRDSRIVPGDVLGAGTVTGGSIGEAIRNGFPARYLEPGDVVEIEVEGIGVLRNTIAPKVNPDPNYRFNAPPPGASAPPRLRFDSGLLIGLGLFWRDLSSPVCETAASNRLVEPKLIPLT